MPAGRGSRKIGRPPDVTHRGCSSSWEQQWTVTSTSLWTVDDGPTSYITIKNPATGFVLDVYQDGRENGNAIVTWYASGTDNQRWHLNLARWNV
jgi:hypothetical protein